jgi:diphthamide synthase (EF-2-diphthine--ammonia ligase)
MVARQYIFLALERLQEGSKIRVTEKGLIFNSVYHAKTFRTEKWLGECLAVRFYGVIYELNNEDNSLRKCGEYGPYEGMKGALWE